jgi:hypothetical protein
MPEWGRLKNARSMPGNAILVVVSNGTPTLMREIRLVTPGDRTHRIDTGASPRCVATSPTHGDANDKILYFRATSHRVVRWRFIARHEALVNHLAGMGARFLMTSGIKPAFAGCQFPVKSVVTSGKASREASSLAV